MPNNIRNQTVYVRSGDPSTDWDTTLYAPGQLGARTTIKQPSPGGSAGAEDNRIKTFQQILTDSTMTTAPYDGAVAWWSDKTRYLVTTSPTALGRGRVAGVFPGAVPVGYYGWVQTQGPATVKVVDAPTAVPSGVGQFVIPSATAGKADVLAAGSAATYPPLGVTAGSWNAAAATVIVDLDIPETP